MVPIKNLFFLVGGNAGENLNHRDAHEEKADMG